MFPVKPCKIKSVLSWHAQMVVKILASLVVEKKQLLKAQAGIRKPEQALWRGLLERISQLVSDFTEASRNYILDFLHKKKIVKP